MIIDVHAHYQRKDGYLDRMLEKSQEAGVEQIWLNGAGHRYGQHDNREVLDACLRHADRLVPIAFSFLDDTTPGQVKAWADEGFRGLKIQFPLAPYDEQRYFGIYEKAEELGMPVLFHTGVSARFAVDDGIRRTSSAFMRPIFLDTIARAFPKLHIIGAHLGFPWFQEAACLMLFNPNIYFDLSGIDRAGQFYPKSLDFKELLWAGTRHWGKLVFGTEGNPDNYSLLVREHRALFSAFNLDPSIQENVFSGNASRMMTHSEK